MLTEAEGLLILSELAKLARSQLTHGNLLRTDSTRRAIDKLPFFQQNEKLTTVEMDRLIASLDLNNDGVVSASEFMGWLFQGAIKKV